VSTINPANGTDGKLCTRLVSTIRAAGTGKVASQRGTIMREDGSKKISEDDVYVACSGCPLRNLKERKVRMKTAKMDLNEETGTVINTSYQKVGDWGKRWW